MKLRKKGFLTEQKRLFLISKTGLLGKEAEKKDAAKEKLQKKSEEKEKERRV
jgi:hypothetical protein